MKKILSYLKKYIKETIFAPLLKMSEALLELFVPIVIANIVDTGVKSGVNFVVNQCLILLALGVLGLLFSVSAQYMSARAAVGMARDDTTVVGGALGGAGLGAIGGAGAGVVAAAIAKSIR